MRYIIEELLLRLSVIRDTVLTRLDSIAWLRSNVTAAKTIGICILVLTCLVGASTGGIAYFSQNEIKNTPPADGNSATIKEATTSTSNSMVPIMNTELSTHTNSTAVPATKSSAQRTESASCNKNYSPCIADSVSDLNCDDIGFSVKVTGSDVYGLDRDSDGIGCDSY